MKDPLLDQIATRDRRFRIVQSVFNATVIVGLVLIGLLVWRGVAAQLKHQDDLNAQRRAETQHQLDQLSGYVKCLASVFAANQNGTVKIADLDTCQLRIDANGNPIPPTSFSTNPSTGEPTQPTDSSTQRSDSGGTTTPPPPAQPGVVKQVGKALNDAAKKTRDIIESITGIKLHG